MVFVVVILHWRTITKRPVYENREEQKSFSDPLVMIYGFYRSGPSGTDPLVMIYGFCRCDPALEEQGKVL